MPLGFWDAQCPQRASYAVQSLRSCERHGHREPDKTLFFAAQKGMPQAANAPAAAPVSALDDLLGLSSALEAPTPAPTQPAGLVLEPRPSLTPALFQGKWGALQPAQRFTLPLPPSALAAIEANGHQVSPLAFRHWLFWC